MYFFDKTIDIFFDIYGIHATNYSGKILKSLIKTFLKESIPSKQQR